MVDEPSVLGAGAGDESAPDTGVPVEESPPDTGVPVDKLVDEGSGRIVDDLLADKLPTPARLRVSDPSSSTRKQVAPTFHVAGFWRRLLGGFIDLAVILPVSLVLGWLAGAVSGIHLPESRHRGVDFWLDLLLANDPAFVGWLGLATVVGCIYLMVFQTTMGRTLGMRATKTRIIDLYGDPPTVSRSGLRTSGYLVGLATLGLGFVWVGFDSEKRGAHDWIAGTYVIKD